MTKNKDLWDISDRPSTKTKLEILEKVFDILLTIWNKQNWVSNEWYAIDLFAGRGKYIDGRNGSPLIFLEMLAEKNEILKKNPKVKLFFVEKNKKTINS